MIFQDAAEPEYLGDPHDPEPEPEPRGATAPSPKPPHASPAPAPEPRARNTYCVPEFPRISAARRPPAWWYQPPPSARTRPQNGLVTPRSRPEAPRRPATVEDGGPVDQVRRLRGDHLQAGRREEPRGLPQVRRALPVPGAQALRPGARPRFLHRA